MARKEVSPELLVEHQEEVGIWKSTKKGKEFDALLNFNFDVTTKVSLGAEQCMWFESPERKQGLFVRIYAIRPLSVSAKTRGVQDIVWTSLS